MNDTESLNLMHFSEHVFPKCSLLEQKTIEPLAGAQTLTQRGGSEVGRQHADFPRDELVADLLEELVGAQHALCQRPGLVLPCRRTQVAQRGFSSTHISRRCCDAFRHGPVAM